MTERAREGVGAAVAENIIIIYWEELIVGNYVQGDKGDGSRHVASKTKGSRRRRPLYLFQVMESRIAHPP